MTAIKKKIAVSLAALTILFFLMTGNSAHSFSGGAPPGYCNSPSNPSTCHACHSSGPTPAVVPGLITSNIPVSGYVPGSTYTVTATVSAVGHNRFGFEISPQDAGGNLLGQMNDLNNETLFQQSGMYITHSSTSLLSNDSKSWQFEWIAPAAGTGSVTFYGAFNITNNDGSYTGDTIVLSTSTFAEDAGMFISNNGTETFQARVWMNESQLCIGNLPSDARQLLLLDYNGQLLWQREITANGVTTGYNEFSLPPGLPVGAYIVQIETSSTVFSNKIISIH